MSQQEDLVLVDEEVPFLDEAPNDDDGCDDGESLGGTDDDAADAEADAEEERQDSPASLKDFVCDDDTIVRSDSVQVLDGGEPVVEEEEEDKEEDESDDESSYVPDLIEAAARYVDTDKDGNPVLSQAEWEDWAAGVVYGVRALRQLLLTVCGDIPSAKVRELGNRVLTTAGIDSSDFGVEPEDIIDNDGAGPSGEAVADV